MTQTLTLAPGAVTLDQLAQIFAGANVTLDPASWPRVQAGAAIVAAAAQGSAAVYGINTGFGKLASKRIPAEQTTTLQRNLIRLTAAVSDRARLSRWSA